MRLVPDLPASIPLQVSSVVRPRLQSRPTPVTTTRRNSITRPRGLFPFPFPLLEWVESTVCMRCFSLCPLHANKRLGMQTEVHMLTKALLLGEHLKSRSRCGG